MRLQGWRRYQPVAERDGAEAEGCAVVVSEVELIRDHHLLCGRSGSVLISKIDGVAKRRGTGDILLDSNALGTSLIIGIKCCDEPDIEEGADHVITAVTSCILPIKKMLTCNCDI